MYNKFDEILGEFGHSSHDFRHSRITELHKGGMSLATLQKFAGHSDPKTTTRYITVSKEDLLQEIRSIDFNQGTERNNEN